MQNQDENSRIRTWREVVIRLKYTNESQPAVSLTAGGIYFDSGTTDFSLPHQIQSGETIVWNGRKVQGPVPTGSVGVLTYKTSDGNTLAVMWSVPFLLLGIFDIFKNRWYVRVFDGARRADQALFVEMERVANNGDDNWFGPEDIGQGYRMSGSMASSTRPILDIHVTKTPALQNNREN